MNTKALNLFRHYNSSLLIWVKHQEYFWYPRWLIVSQATPTNMKTRIVKGERLLLTKHLDCKRWETTSNKALGLIILFGESKASVRLHNAICQPHHLVDKCWPKAILLPQTSISFIILHPKHNVQCGNRDTLPSTLPKNILSVYLKFVCLHSIVWTNGSSHRVFVAPMLFQQIGVFTNYLLVCWTG